MKTFEEIILNSEVGQIWEGETYIIKINANGKVIQRKDKKDLKGNTIILWDDAKFKLQRKKYTFAEAFKEYEEGKEIESIYSGHKYSMDGDGDLTVTVNEDGGLYYDDSAKVFSLGEVIGEWFVNN